MNLRMGASEVGSKVWVLTIGVLEVNHEVESIRAQRGRARSALFSRVNIMFDFRCKMLNPFAVKAVRVESRFQTPPPCKAFHTYLCFSLATGHCRYAP